MDNNNNAPSPAFCVLPTVSHEFFRSNKDSDAVGGKGGCSLYAHISYAVGCGRRRKGLIGVGELRGKALVHRRMIA